jgi:putative ABC transport system ATP-binding protein
MTDETLAVSCRGVTKAYGNNETRVQALRGLDLDIRMGELAMLVGPSGCGKTTLISVITGLLNATSGDVAVLGEWPSRMSARDQIVFRQRHIGFVFQQFNLLPALTAAENVAVPLLVGGWRWQPAVEAATTLLETLGLGDRARSLPSQLSGGQQQRVAVARALVHEPELVVCDEPTSALDAQTGQRVMELLSEHAVRADRAVIVVTHDSRVFEFADTIAHMDDGRVTHVEQGPQRERRPAAPVAEEAVLVH